ncbi:TPA: phosphoribosyltransferase [candidate division CPR2 bacterium]|uniref:Phosphoribosyltransferase n=1 Tax=candidate division CPR2 bacterium GW2011_GWC1_41_48 TaxID=1618344 RepID=A0A0G0W9Y8_UNCC2|nr:MAG: Phosphoribosyltransferase [candidate division CPR2 bacterium GW2011_GWC2_39_35]KKR28118.1 MAG: Phosphoribosyltransferase [candidate division CPR2 bacterium GW2011_GWD2_39_7]KKR29557.1 MAG: Phosphoribosyltransferase [candidate division CPR2 bacterium GW2011_GWD1_39_7]KKS09824.1 MAG: Phosphoribosyltransferase [candidate division CPR2 bacterium GW2011_GWC1_41_48]OGB55863.1 MAG: hypothetical protein A2Y27_00375 [candidate division CPR2 bacterium GWD1_39_7]OGB72241.1 MAG: hypothetical prote
MFKNRVEAGKELASHLLKYKSENGIVLGLPRGGVVPACKVAKALNWPLDVFISRKITAPLNPEYAIGAITENGLLELNDELISELPDIDAEYIAHEIKHQKEEIARRKELFRNGRDLPDLKKKTVILVDDGVATGFTLLAAINSLRKLGAKKIIAAVPIVPKEIKKAFNEKVDQFIALKTPEVFFAVGEFYEEFPQVEDEEVIKILQKK